MSNSKLINKRSDCRICGNKNIKKIIDLGIMPLAGNFIEKKNLKKKEFKIPLDLYYCSKCKLVQIRDTVKPKVLFKKYNYSSSTIPVLNQHFLNYSKEIIKNYKKKNNFKILEFGCNDGILLSKLFKLKNFFCLGVDPSKNIVKLAKKKSIKVYNDYFNTSSANRILKKYDKFDYITASNVFAHIDDIHSVIKASKILLKDDGYLVVEVHYLLNLLNLNQYDFFYHEHVNYYSIYSLKYLFEMHNFEIKKIKQTNMHGGSLRVYLKKKKNYFKNKNLNIEKLIKNEKKLNLSFFKKFNKKIYDQKNEISKILKNIKKQNKKIIGFGASGRGTTFLNFCKIDKKYIDIILDSSPFRAGKYMPGIKIPIKNLNFFKKNYINYDYVLIIAWNYQASIIKQVKGIKNNIKFIIPFPKPKIL